MRTFLQSLCAVLMLAVSMRALPAAAQQYPSQARGLGGAVAYQTGDVDHVNLFNGQLSITLPLGQGYPVGPGFGSGLAFAYTSNLWDFNELQTCSTPGGLLVYYPPEIDPKTNAGPGGRVSLGKLEEPFAPDTRWRYFPPDGGEVIFYSTLHPGFPAAGAQPNVFFSNDGSYRRLRQSSSTAQCHTVPGTATACRLLELPGPAHFNAEIHRPAGTVFGSERFQPLASRYMSVPRVTEVTRYPTSSLAGRKTLSLFLIGTLSTFNPNTGQTYFYEGLDGRVSKRLTSLKVPQITTYAFETDFTWNHLGLLDEVGYPQCLHTKCTGRDPPRTISHDYSRGFLTAVPGYASAIDYQGGGMLHQVQHTNGVTYTMERESASALDRPFRISTNLGWSTGTYAYDGAGQIKQIGTQDFRYDRFKRLISGEVTVGTQDRVQSASYDVYNNLLSLTTNGSTLTTTTSASTNRLTSFSATYDAFGSLTQQIRSGETHKYTWDPLGVMKYLQSTADQAQVFLYDADDERLATYDCFPGVCDSPGWELRTTVRGLGGEPLREYATQGVDGWHWVRDYVYRGGALLAAVEPDSQGGEEVFHFHLDHLGTPRQITNASGAQVALHSYYPFGQEATVPTQTSFTKKFTGHERDDNGASLVGDLDYMHARYGSPTLSRFLSFDPIGGNRHNPQSWNRYAYALNSPMNYTDPEGLFALLFMDLAFVVFDEITVTARSYSDILELFRYFGIFFSEERRPSIYGELGQPTPPAAGLLRARDGDELERVRFRMPYGAIDTGGVPEFFIFLPVGRITKMMAVSKASQIAIQTPYGPAVQSTSLAALEVRSAAGQGATLYRSGVLGKSAGPEAQFWSLENPLSAGYASRYGIPAENVAFDFVEAGTIRPGTAFITREAPGLGANAGGAIEIVVRPGGVALRGFYSP